MYPLTFLSTITKAKCIFGTCVLLTYKFLIWAVKEVFEKLQNNFLIFNSIIFKICFYFSSSCLDMHEIIASLWIPYLYLSFLIYLFKGLFNFPNVCLKKIYSTFTVNIPYNSNEVFNYATLKYYCSYLQVNFFFVFAVYYQRMYSCYSLLNPISLSSCANFYSTFLCV